MEVLQLLLPLHRALHARRDLADVIRPLVHPLEERLQPLAEGLITGRATEPTGLLEIRLGEPTRRAFLHASPAFDLLRGPEPEQQIRQREARRVGLSLLLGAR